MNATHITGYTKAGTGDNKPVVVFVDGVESNTNVTFSYFGPFIDHIEPALCNTSGCAITLHGSDFGVPDSDIHLF